MPAPHMTRQRDTPNADPARRDQNMVLIGGDDPAADVAALVPALDARGEDGRRRRSNSVLAIEVLLTASPSGGPQPTPTRNRRGWTARRNGWSASMAARTSRTCGCTATSAPPPYGVHRSSGPGGRGLNARRWIGGAHRCAQQQTDYAAVVEPLGLRRGVEGSTAEHERVKRHYGQIAAPVTELKIERPPRLIIDPEGWATEQAASVAQQAAPALARAQTAESDRTARKSAVAQATKERGRRERAEASLERQKAVTDRMRALPLPDVLDALGFQQDKAEPDRWRAEGFNVTIGTGQKAGKWWDHAAQTGRGGAIDLTAHALGCDFKGALAWLSDRFGPGPTAADLTARMRAEAVAQVKAAIAEREPFTPPAPTTEHWPEVRRHLTADRALPAPYIDRLHELGDCYADARRNAVFLCRDEAGRVVGAEMKGTVKRSDGSRFSGMAPGSAKDAGGFRLGALAKAATVYLVESAIDAISLARLRAAAGEGFAIISTAGTTPQPRRWFAGIAETVRRVCAFDNDRAGDKAAEGLLRHRFERLRPRGKDWNDDLRAATKGQSEGGAANPAPTTEVLKAAWAAIGGRAATPEAPDDGSVPDDTELGL